jgi:phytoene synthase
MFALYAFARTTDDLGDSHDPISVRTVRLDWWREITRLNLECDGMISSDGLVGLDHAANADAYLQVGFDLRFRAISVLPALLHTARQFSIPTRYFLEIVDGVKADQQKTRFDTYEQVEHYCYLVASAVGLACLHIWEFEGELPVQSAIDCGIAFQLTNILRDIIEDAERGRIYLPRQHYEKHGLTEDDLLQPRRDDRLRCLILDEASRADVLYRSGWNVWSSLHPDGRRMFSMMWRTYRELLHQIQKKPMLVVAGRVRVPLRFQMELLATHCLPAIFDKLPMPLEDSNDK